MRNLIGTPSINEMAGSSALGQKLPRRPRTATSVVTPAADIGRPRRHVGFVPTTYIADFTESVISRKRDGLAARQIRGLEVACDRPLRTVKVATRFGSVSANPHITPTALLISAQIDE
jgi:hypothetical protein